MRLAVLMLATILVTLIILNLWFLKITADTHSWLVSNDCVPEMRIDY